ncbi:MAG: ATP-binding cassette domain-containing protein, partial [Devosia sp.]
MRIEGLRKSYGGVRALDDVSLAVRRGSIHALIGENGAGKSTLMKILAGAQSQDEGALLMDDKAMRFRSPEQARRSGIAIVYQELSMLPTRSVLANLFVNREPTRFGFVSTRTMRKRAYPILAQLGLADLDLNLPVRALPIADQQLVEIAKALLTEPKILLLDEPNSALNRTETQRLFSILRRLRAEGITMLYVSHRLEEVREICDEITVMRNGEVVLSRPTVDLTIGELVEAMLGRRQKEL